MNCSIPTAIRPVLRWALVILAMALLASCGGGSSNRCEARPCVFTGFAGDLDWLYGYRAKG